MASADNIDIVIVSNFFNHHMLPLCQALFQLTQGRFRFIATEEIPIERIQLGYKSMNDEHEYVVCAYKGKKEKESAKELCNHCKALIYGSASPEYYIGRLLAHKLAFRYSERIFKTKSKVKDYPKQIIRYVVKDLFTQYSNHYLLAASAYAAYDYDRIGLFKGRRLKWGYFPPVTEESTEKLWNKKQGDHILWVGRMIPYKQPMIAVKVANILKTRNVDFKMTMVGNGELQGEVDKAIDQYGLKEQVTVLGAKANHEVRELMEASDIFLFTSNEEEGWGAVLNEAMNSACACVSYIGIGAVPFLVRDYKNGLVYDRHDPELIADKCETLLHDQSLRYSISQNANETIQDVWNATVVSKRLYAFISDQGSAGSRIYRDGPLSQAEVIKRKAK